MYDRDVQLIQFCAATLPPNTFILHCLNKFNLINWASKDFAVSEEESIRYTHVQLQDLCHYPCLFLECHANVERENYEFSDGMIVMSEIHW